MADRKPRDIVDARCAAWQLEQALAAARGLQIYAPHRTDAIESYFADARRSLVELNEAAADLGFSPNVLSFPPKGDNFRLIEPDGGSAA